MGKNSSSSAERFGWFNSILSG